MSILNIILGWHTPHDLPIPSIHNAIAHLMSNALLMATRHEALKNDVESGGVKNVSGKCCIIVQSAITFVVILGWHTPQDVPIPSIHNAIAVAMSICVAVGNKVMDSPVCLSL